MYELPPVGSRYVRDGQPWRVRDVDETADPARVDLERDEAWAEELRAALPEGYALGGGRNSDSGRWHLYASEADGAIYETFVSEGSLEDAIAAVVAKAERHARG